mmetsp:Transcript_41695/g.107955  ORF Transcript_41695/g.107955 Transcript_41695/m.107955 type:complete len:363 (+) Transcript_41695:1107-2195(+)
MWMRRTMNAWSETCSACASRTACLVVLSFFCSFMAYSSPVLASCTLMTLPKPPAPSVPHVLSEDMWTRLPCSLMPSRTWWNCSPTPLSNMYDMSPVLSLLELVPEPRPAAESRPMRGPKSICRSLESQASTCGPLLPFFGEKQLFRQLKLGSAALRSSSAISCDSAEGASAHRTWLGVCLRLFGCCSSSSVSALLLLLLLPRSFIAGPSSRGSPPSAHCVGSGGCSSISAIRMSPARHARCSGFSQFASVWLGSAPLRNKSSAHSRRPFIAATCSAVAWSPSLLGMFTSHPASIISCSSSTRPLATAMKRSVPTWPTLVSFLMAKQAMWAMTIRLSSTQPCGVLMFRQYTTVAVRNCRFRST